MGVADWKLDSKCPHCNWLSVCIFNFLFFFQFESPAMSPNPSLKHEYSVHIKLSVISKQQWPHHENHYSLVWCDSPVRFNKVSTASFKLCFQTFRKPCIELYLVCKCSLSCHHWIIFAGFCLGLHLTLIIYSLWTSGQSWTDRGVEAGTDHLLLNLDTMLHNKTVLLRGSHSRRESPRHCFLWG